MNHFLERGDILFVTGSNRTYNENTALQLAQKRYYEKNKEDILIKRKEYRKKQKESENIDEIKARQRESRIKYYNKQKLLKQQEHQPEPEPPVTQDEDKIAVYMDMFNKIFKT